MATVTVAASGCGAESHPAAKVNATPSRRCAAGARDTLRSSRVAWAATARRALTAYRAPGGAPIRSFGLRNANGAPAVFGVLERQVDARCRATWLRVGLPIRPNGASGWIRAASVNESRVQTRIVVDLSARRLRLYRDDRLVLSATVAVGSSATPTPVGRYYVNQRLVPTDPTGPYGPGAVGISAFSPVLTDWRQGGPIAIHGTNEPWSIGHAVSNGCIRLPNATLRRVLAQAVEGTPVLIRS